MIEFGRRRQRSKEFFDRRALTSTIGMPRAEAVIEAITSKAKTGQIGDGKIFVTPLEQVVRIRAGEIDGDAL